MTTGRRIFTGLLIAGNVWLTGYVALLAWLLTGLILEDSVAARLAAGDWYAIALWRFALIGGLGLLVVALAFLVNRWLLAHMLPDRPRLARWLGVASGVIVLLAAAAGSVQFAVTKPYF